MYKAKSCAQDNSVVKLEVGEYITAVGSKYMSCYVHIGKSRWLANVVCLHRCLGSNLGMNLNGHANMRVFVPGTKYHASNAKVAVCRGYQP